MTIRHVNLVPKLSWYLAPQKIVYPDKTEENGNVYIMNDDGTHKYEFWMDLDKQVRNGTWTLFREYSDGAIQYVCVFMDKFEIEDYKETI